MRTYDIKNWFWKIGSNESVVWSSAKAGLVPTNDSDYLQYLDDGQMAVPVDTQENMFRAFADNFPAGSLWTYAAAKRYEKEVGGLTVGGVAISTDDRSKVMMMGARIAAEATPEFTTDWVGADGSVHHLNAASMIAVSNAVLAHVAQCFSTYATVKAQIEANVITTLAEIDEAFA